MTDLSKGGNAMLRIAICDDQEIDRAAACRGVEAYLAAHPGFSGQVDVFSYPAALLDALEAGATWDVALLDVYMPGQLGTQLAQELRRRLPKLSLLFLTTSLDHAIEAFALGAAHYLVKPFTQELLDNALDRAIAPYLGQEDKRLPLQMENGATYAVPLEDLIYIESAGHRQTVHTVRGDFDERQQTLSALHAQLELLSPEQFIAPYRGYIVNQSFIRTITAQGILLHSGVKIPLKEGDFRKTKSAYFQWAFGKEWER